MKKLKSEFESRVRKNPRYSLRAFAKFLDIEASSLSGILNGKRQIPRRKIGAVIKKLALSPKEAHLFQQSIFKKNEPSGSSEQEIHELEFLLDNETHFNIIAEWEHGALLSLMETKDYQHCSQWMADRLRVPKTRIKTCLHNLISARLAEFKDGAYSRIHDGAYTTEDIPSGAIKRAHHTNLQLGDAAIDDVEVELRDLSSMTLTLQPQDLAELKNDIRHFRKRFMKKAEQSPGEEVYKLSIQLIPLTKTLTKG